MKWYILSILLTVWSGDVSAYFITVDAHAEECFFEKVETGTKMGLMFEIAEGGFLDIDVKIVGPDSKIIHEGAQQNSGKFTFAAYTPGVYTYCFSNEKSTMTPKLVMFNIDMETSHKQVGDGKHAEGQEGDEANHGKLEEMIKELSTSLWGMKVEQEYMQVRDRNHRAINESTNFRVVMWSFFEAAVLVCMTLGQVFYLKRFFEVRRVV